MMISMLQWAATVRSNKEWDCLARTDTVDGQMAHPTHSPDLWANQRNNNPQGGWCPIMQRAWQEWSTQPRGSSLGEITTRIQNPRNMGKDNVSKSLPILDGKPLNGYVPRVLSRLLGIDQFNGWSIVFTLLKCKQDPLQRTTCERTLNDNLNIAVGCNV